VPGSTPPPPAALSALSLAYELPLPMYSLCAVPCMYMDLFSHAPPPSFCSSRLRDSSLPVCSAVYIPLYGYVVHRLYLAARACVRLVLFRVCLYAYFAV
jgi:hypothetical protein